jgi:CDP-paratose 2-epimerase
MRVAITGLCGFVGSSIARCLLDSLEGVSIVGIDNLVRPGSELNRGLLGSLGIRVIHGDIRIPSDLEMLPDSDWVIDAAANPSVLAGVDGKTTSRQLMEHNLAGTLNVLEYCRRTGSGFIMLSTSRVYSIQALNSMPVASSDTRFVVRPEDPMLPGASMHGISELFSVAPPISLYGSSKLASEVVALEYGFAFNFPVWIDRCGVLAGAGQFGTAEQGIFSYWLHAHAARRPLRYIGFDGRGFQVRDAFHPQDLTALVIAQMKSGHKRGASIYNVGGGTGNSMSLCELNAWCNDRFGKHTPEADTRPRAFDIPWLVMDSSLAGTEFGWTPRRSLQSILEEISRHVQDHPDWLSRCGVQ